MNGADRTTAADTIHAVRCAIIAPVLHLSRLAMCGRWHMVTTDGEPWAIEARGLTKTFGKVTAVRDVTLQVVCTGAAYYGSLRFAGCSFERRIEIISSRLA